MPLKASQNRATAHGLLVRPKRKPHAGTSNGLRFENLRKSGGAIPPRGSTNNDIMKRWWIDREEDPQVICTTLQQAQTLVKLGVDPDTADMSWTKSPFTPKKLYGEDQYCLFSYPNASTSADPTPTPCWSVGAMARLLPAGMQFVNSKEESLRDIVFNTLVNYLSE